MKLRKYQTEAVNNLRTVLAGGCKRPVMVLPTGGGKSIIFAQIIKSVVENGKKVLWLVHRRNLVFQMRDVLRQFGIEPGLIMAGTDRDLYSPVQLGTIQTFAKRSKLYLDADIVLIDEAHRSLSRQYLDIIDLFSNKIIIGCTATPMRGDQRGLGEVYDSIVDVVDVTALTEQNYLCPVKYYAVAKPDLSDVTIRLGDYAVNELEKKTNTKKLNGDIVANWLKLSEDRKTIVFCVNVRHSIAVCDEFVRNGINAEHLDARSSDETRENVFARMQSGEITVICNVGLYQEGLDVPDVSCIVIARPTKSLGLWRQMGGRGLRVADGKDACFIFDHGGVIEENGYLDDEIAWTLDGKKRAWKKPGADKIKRKCKCTVCGLVFEAVNKCPDCGSPVEAFGKKIETTDGELEELKGKKKFTMVEKRVWYGMFKYRQLEKGYSRGWIAHKFRERFSVWPKGFSGTEPIIPNQEFKNWITYQNIKWAKRRVAV